jgi:predicted RNA-binding Zn ribbon-like protein
MSGSVSPSAAPFKFVGGDLALDLVNTVDWTEQGPALDRLSSYLRLLEWAEGAGVIGRSVAAALRRRAAHEPSEAARALGLARRIRAAIQASASALSEGRDPAPALRLLDALLPRALVRLRLEADRGGDARGVRLSWEGFGASLDSPLWPVLWSAVQLFTSPEVTRVRMCTGESCGWVYLDRSRNGLRRWCQMSTCGTTAKNRRRGRQARRAPGVQRTRSRNAPAGVSRRLHADP